ncbi:uncharacterized protein LOC111245038 isoform X3 [Varroa destructor]|uniref:Beta-1,4-glucuronyltransferase 1 n=1 Tax=Varroa destructor TaxID=109461 RepID=A0A7M7JA44_VARDE|nr:uncharacterized protein LOC111245038 isoform X3 [Varroa destructor]
MMLWRSVSQAAVLLSVFIAFILILLLLHPARPLIGGYRGGNAASVHFRDGMHNVNITNPSHFFVNRAALALSLKEAARDYDEYSLRLMNHTGIPFFRRNKADVQPRMLLLTDLNEPNPVTSPQQVCIAAYGTLSDLHHAVELSWLWKTSPVSVAIFAAPGEAHLVLEYLQYLSTCHRGVRAHFNFDLLVAHPEDLQQKEDEAFYSKFACEEYREALSYQLSRRSKSLKREENVDSLPVNELRNIGQQSCRRGMGAQIGLTLPLGAMPRPGLDIELASFLARLRTTSSSGQTCDKCIYVIPTFISSQSLKVPRTKAAVDALVTQDRLMPDDELTYCRWTAFKGNSVTASGKGGASSPNITLTYQPTPRFFKAYVAPLDLPRMDTRFKGVDAPPTQLIEAYLQGYRFWVLSEAFIVRKVFGHRVSKSVSSTSMKIKLIERSATQAVQKLPKGSTAASVVGDPTAADGSSAADRSEKSAIFNGTKANVSHNNSQFAPSRRNTSALNTDATNKFKEDLRRKYPLIGKINWTKDELVLEERKT